MLWTVPSPLGWAWLRGDFTGDTELILADQRTSDPFLVYVFETNGKANWLGAIRAVRSYTGLYGYQGVIFRLTTKVLSYRSLMLRTASLGMFDPRTESVRCWISPEHRTRLSEVAFARC